MSDHSTEEQLRAEIESLKRRLESRETARRGPSTGTMIGFAVVAIVLIVAGFFVGYLPRQRREEVLAAEARDNTASLPLVTFDKVERSDGDSRLVLPGNIQAVTEAPIVARATGYIRKRNVDIGDHVKNGQVVAEIEAPELDQQILQARAAIEQARSSAQQAQAALAQGKANESLAQANSVRYANLFKRGVVSRQDNDTYQAQWAAQQANVQALEKAVAAAQSNVAAAEANLARLAQLKTYQTVRAPFDGVITVRNVDTGALVTDGATMLFRIAQTSTLRTYVNLPQSNAESVKPGQRAAVTIAELPGRKFQGVVTRTANALDPATRTLLTEVQVSNASGELMPGMFAQVDLAVARPEPPLIIAGDTLVIRSDGPQVATLREDDTVHFAKIKLGRDYGDRIEVLSGVNEGDRIVVNPRDVVREGVKVKPVAKEAPARKQ
ncbi:MAG: efflux RND transporter periplasmic adaptor subunit [Acidobacteria bacterium]|nr:efflux RND transporter periplasmic adaptor subunit [Acidobacteriota bacterium]